MVTSGAPSMEAVAREAPIRGLPAPPESLTCPGRWAPGHWPRTSITLGLHPGPDQGQWVAGQLTTGAGHGATGQEHKYARVGAVYRIALQPGVLERLKGERGSGMSPSASEPHRDLVRPQETGALGVGTQLFDPHRRHFLVTWDPRGYCNPIHLACLPFVSALTRGSWIRLGAGMTQGQQPLPYTDSLTPGV